MGCGLGAVLCGSNIIFNVGLRCGLPSCGDGSSVANNTMLQQYQITLNDFNKNYNCLNKNYNKFRIVA
jgi:hypothetical protein